MAEHLFYLRFVTQTMEATDQAQREAAEITQRLQADWTFARPQWYVKVTQEPKDVKVQS